MKLTLSHSIGLISMKFDWGSTCKLIRRVNHKRKLDFATDIVKISEKSNIHDRLIKGLIYMVKAISVECTRNERWQHAEKCSHNSFSNIGKQDSCIALMNICSLRLVPKTIQQLFLEKPQSKRSICMIQLVNLIIFVTNQPHHADFFLLKMPIW